ncbi:hypothetical protein GKU98_06750 [Salmonella enterica]|nr:hypothetical protein [Salmonella enterica subsp. enterica serovar Brunei]EEC0278685.1 hypothetical protein [Salmonella enterica subsp. enterica]EEF3368299.1 hypothetical protein [Salmonella enterica]EBX8594503.1 hypothetical protein [Salmonella enterica subsp. enterica serovar Brunei]ECD1419868.1 hypothetical protein [Salmonella enterica subsp. enterica serovar Brunei]
MSAPTSIIGFQAYQPDPQDLCSLCGGNCGKESMIECKNKIHVCLECVGLLSEIKKEREMKKRNETVLAIKNVLIASVKVDYGDDQRHSDALFIYDQICAGKIPGLKLE